MNSLDLFSIRALMQALQQIHSTMDLFELPGSLFAAVRGLVPDSRLSIDQLDLTTGVVMSVSSEDRFFSEEMKRRIVELMPSHPVMPTVKPGARGAIRVTDCITQRQFHQTPHYVETLRPINIHYQMLVTLDIPGTIAPHLRSCGRLESRFVEVRWSSTG